MHERRPGNDWVGRQFALHQAPVCRSNQPNFTSEGIEQIFFFKLPFLKKGDKCAISLITHQAPAPVVA